MALVALWAPPGAMRGRDSRGRNSRPDSEIRGGVSSSTNNGDRAECNLIPSKSS
jgi:hypothetical protein